MSKGTTADAGIIRKLFEDAEKLRAEKDDFLARQEANRSALRTLRDAGLMSAEDATAVEDLYPTRKRRAQDETAGDAAAAA